MLYVKRRRMVSYWRGAQKKAADFAAAVVFMIAASGVSDGSHLNQ